MWEAKDIAAAADAATETNWKHKVTPDWGDLMKLCEGFKATYQFPWPGQGYNHFQEVLC